MENPGPPWPPPVWVPPTPQSPVPPDPPVARRRVRAGNVLLALFVLLVVASVVSRWRQGEGPPWADEWDPRVRPLAEFVEGSRGLPFRHPVAVDFVPEDDFLAEIRAARAAVGAGSVPGTPDLPFERAFGLVPDSFEQAQSTSDEAAGVVGSYDPSTRRIRLRGTELTPSVRVTLVHELTHALQDQHFGLNEVRSRPDTNAAVVATLAVIEGDAVLVERDYIDGLSAADFDVLVAAEGAVVDAPELDRVPGALLADVQMPYVLGPTFVAALDVLGTVDSRDDVFRAPPASDLAVLFPERHLAGALVVERPAAPDLGVGEVAIDSGRYGDDLGAFAWLTVLAGRLDASTALGAVSDLAGDRYVTFERAGAACARAHLLSAGTAGAGRLAAAFESWAALGPPGAATVEVDDRTVTVASCDTGPADDPAEDGRFQASLLLLDLRNEPFAVPAPFGRSDASLEDRSCVARTYVEAVTPADLAAQGQDALDRFAAIGRDAGRSCGLIG